MAPIKYDPNSGQLEVTITAHDVVLRVKQFVAGVAGQLQKPAQGLLWPRWIALRVLGLCFVIGFAGLCFDGVAFLSPNGFRPFCAGANSICQSGGPLAWLAVPSLLWIDSSETTIALFAWSGLISSILLLLNFRPRAALFTCWLLYLSLVSWLNPFPADFLLLEASLLGLLIAPPGWRPGLAPLAPPPKAGIFLFRWLCARMLITSALAKLAWPSNTIWLNFKAFDHYFEHVYFPTWLDFAAHNASEAWRTTAVALVLAIEWLAPLLIVTSIFGAFGRTLRLLAFGFYTSYHLFGLAFENFGWFHLLALGIGPLLLDDARLSRVFRRPQMFSGSETQSQATWRHPWAQRAASCYACIYLAFTFLVFDWIPLRRNIVVYLSGLKISMPYTQFDLSEPRRFGVRVEGSSDGGQSWKAYEPRNMIKYQDRLSPWLVPYLPRFEAMLARADNLRDESTYKELGQALLRRNKLVLSLFREDPFRGAAPTDLRFVQSRLRFTTQETARQLGQYWTFVPAGFFTQSLHIDLQTLRITTLPVVEFDPINGT